MQIFFDYISTHYGISKAFNVLETGSISYVNHMISYTLSKIAFKHLLRMNIMHYNNSNVVEIIKNLDTDVNNISKISDKFMFYVLEQIFKTIGGIIGLIIINWKLTIIVASIFPIKFLIIKYLTSKKEKSMQDYIKCNGKYFGWLGDTIEGMRKLNYLDYTIKKIGAFLY